MGRKTENTGFKCQHCGTDVQPLKNGSYRNHCPHCLYSKHMDIVPGDRESSCKGLMEPIGMKCSQKGHQLIHRCSRCGAIRINKVAEDPVQSDETDELARLPLIELPKHR